MFCEVEGLRPQATIKGVMDVVECMNTVFSCFDSLTDRFSVYKVIINYVILIRVFGLSVIVDHKVCVKNILIKLKSKKEQDEK